MVRERHQRPRVGDLGRKWKIFYWDYSSGTRRGRTKSWAKSVVAARTEAQRLADHFMETANGRNNEPQLFPSGEETRNNGRSCGDLSRKDVAVAEEFIANQLRLLSQHVLVAQMGFNETHENEDH